MKKIIFCCLIAVLFSCGKDDEPITGTIFSVNYIQEYLYPEELELAFWEGGTLLGCFQGEWVNNRRPKDEERYAVLSEKYNDKNWNQRTLPGSTIVIDESVEYLTVTCDRRFDEGHDTGVSLNDLVMLRASSPYDFIRDGYKITDPSLPREGVSDGFIVTEGLLSEIGIKDIRLLNPEFRLTFTKFPAPGEYIFTVTAKIGEKEINQSIKITF